ncbi:MAG: tetratricopeptide repeat protein, partial [Muribaculaceae bacterium]
MKFKIALSLLALGTALSTFAQGYKDGLEYYNAGQYENAKVLLERNFDKPETDKAISAYFLGRIALRDNDIATAKKYFDQGIAANPEGPFNYIGRGALLLKEGKIKEAEQSFKEGTSKEKKNPSVYVAVARAYYLANPTTYAKEITKNIEKAKKTDRKDPNAYLFEGDMLAAEKKWGDAAGYYEMAILYDNNLSAAYVKYANTYFYVNPKVAIEKLEKLLEVNPNSALAQRELAEKYYENDEWTKAAAAYGAYIKNPNHFKRDEERYAVLLYFGERYQESLDLANNILSQNPDAFLMKRMVFLNKAALKDYAGAEQAALPFFGDTNPNNKHSSNDYTTYGDVLKALGRQAESLSQFEKAVEINPEKTELLKDLSSAYSSAENYE